MTKNLKAKNLKYCDDFIEKYKDERTRNGGITPPFPDHAILTADVYLFN